MDDGVFEASSGHIQLLRLALCLADIFHTNYETMKSPRSSYMEPSLLSKTTREDSTFAQAENVEKTCVEKAPHSATTAGLRVHEWGLNPLFWSYLKLFSRDVHAMGTLEGIDDSHVLHGKAALRVEVSGIVVHIKICRSCVKYLLDDGTGLVACTQYERDGRSGALHQTHAERHDLGEFLIVHGKLKRYRGTREVAITSVRKPNDPNEEVLQWLQCVELAKTVYKPPFLRHEYIDDEVILSSSQARAVRCECGASYSNTIGYCRCVAPPLACDASFEFRDALLADLAAKENSLPSGEHLRFQFARDIRDNPSLRDAAARVVLAARSIAPGAQTRDSARADGGVDHGGERTLSEAVLKAKVMELLRAVVFSLHRDGALHFSDKAKDIYVLLSRGRVLEPHVKQACFKLELGLTQENEIIRALQSTALFHHVSGARIRACIQRIKSAEAEN